MFGPFVALADEMRTHIEAEEDDLSPAVRKLDRGEPLTEVEARIVRREIDGFEGDHEETADRLDGTADPTDDYAVPRTPVRVTGAFSTVRIAGATDAPPRPEGEQLPLSRRRVDGERRVVTDSGSELSPGSTFRDASTDSSAQGVSEGTCFAFDRSASERSAFRRSASVRFAVPIAVSSDRGPFSIRPPENRVAHLSSVASSPLLLFSLAR